jgi:hypothetical protein
MRRDGGVGDSPVATGDGGMPNIEAMILTGARHSEEEDARTTAWKDGASALGSASGRCQVDRRVRASQGQRLARQIESLRRYCQSPFQASLRDRKNASCAAACDFANAAE